MADRIDHAATAYRTLDEVDWRDRYASVQVAEAQVHATLALVEQQRIANLIIVAGWVMDSTVGDVGHDLDKLRMGIAGEVWEGLGLS